MADELPELSSMDDYAPLPQREIITAGDPSVSPALPPAPAHAPSPVAPQTAPLPPGLAGKVASPYEKEPTPLEKKPEAPLKGFSYLGQQIVQAFKGNELVQGIEKLATPPAFDGPTMSGEEATEKYGNGFNIQGPVTPAEAKEQAQYKQDMAERQQRLDNGVPAIPFLAAGKAISFASSMISPTNLALSVVPIPGVEEGVIAKSLFGEGALNFAQRASARGLSGATKGAVLGSAIAPLEASIASSEGRDYTFKDVSQEILSTTAQIAGLHVVGGVLEDWLKPGESALLKQGRAGMAGGDVNVPVEKQQGLVPSIIHREAQMGGEELNSEERTVMAKAASNWSISDEEVYSELKKREAQSGPVTQALQAAEDLQNKREGRLSPEQENELEQLEGAQGNRDLTDQELARRQELRAQQEGAYRLSAPDSLLSGQEVTELRRLDRLRQRATEAFSPQERDLLGQLEQRRSQATPVDPGQLAQQRLSDVRDMASQPEAPPVSFEKGPEETKNNEQPPPSPDPRRDIEEQAPDKLQEFDDADAKNKAIHDAYSTAIDCMVNLFSSRYAK